MSRSRAFRKQRRCNGGNTAGEMGVYFTKLFECDQASYWCLFFNIVISLEKYFVSFILSLLKKEKNKRASQRTPKPSRGIYNPLEKNIFQKDHAQTAM